MINAGRYRARATEAALGLTRKGGEQVAVALSIIDGECAGESLTWFGFFSEKTADRTIESLRTLGWVGDDLSDLTGVDSNEVEIVVEHEEYEGRSQVRVKWINRSGAALGLKERMDPGAAKAFAAQMRGAVIAQRAKGGAPPTVAARPATAPRSVPQAVKHSERRAPSADPLADADMGEDVIPF